MPAQLKNRGTPCGCCHSCTIFFDSFQDRDEKINGITGNWSGVPDRSLSVNPDSFWVVGTPGGTSGTAGVISPFWNGTQIFTHFPTTAGPFTLPAGPYRLILLSTALDLPRQFKCSVLAHPIPSGKTQIVYQALSSDPLASKRFGFEIEANEFFGFEDGFQTACGYMRLWDLTDLLAPVQLGKTIPVPGLNASYHRQTLCYDPETKILSANVTLSVFSRTATHYNEVHAMHAHDVETAADPLDSSQIWLEVIGFPATSGGQYAFRDFKISQTTNLPDFDPDYGYDEGDPECPCCGPKGCQTKIFTFDDIEELDCLWTVESGSISFGSDDYGRDYLILDNGGAHVEYNGSWSGITGDCQPDRTFHFAAEVLINIAVQSFFMDVADTHGGAKLRAGFTSENSEGAGDGTISIYDSGGLLIDSVAAPIPYSQWFTAKVCYDGETLTATALGESVEGPAADTGGVFVGVENPGGTEVWVNSLTFGHDIYSADCADCTPTSDCDTCCDEPKPTTKYIAVLPSDAQSAHCSGVAAVPRCETIAGSYLISEDEETTCQWRYTEALEFSAACCDEGLFVSQFGILVSLETFDETHCRWVGVISFGETDDPSAGDSCVFDEGEIELGSLTSRADYESAPFPTGNCRELATLIKTSETATPATCWDFPDSFTWRAP